MSRSVCKIALNAENLLHQVTLFVLPPKIRHNQWTIIN
jgi:hypothetical protein